MAHAVVAHRHGLRARGGDDALEDDGAGRQDRGTAGVETGERCDRGRRQRREARDESREGVAPEPVTVHAAGIVVREPEIERRERRRRAARGGERRATQRGPRRELAAGEDAVDVRGERGRAALRQREGAERQARGLADGLTLSEGQLRRAAADVDHQERAPDRRKPVRDRRVRERGLARARQDLEGHARRLLHLARERVAVGGPAHGGGCERPHPVGPRAPRARGKGLDGRDRPAPRVAVEESAVAEPRAEARGLERGVDGPDARIEPDRDRQQQHGVAADVDRRRDRVAPALPRRRPAGGVHHATDCRPAESATSPTPDIHRSRSASAREASASFLSRPRSEPESGGKSP